MVIKNFNVYYFLFLLIGVSVLASFLFIPFLSSIVVAAVLAIMFQGPYRMFYRLSGKRKAFSAFLVCLLVVLVIVIPLSLMIGLVGSEINLLIQEITKPNSDVQKLIREYSEVLATYDIKYADIALTFPTNGEALKNLSSFSSGIFGVAQTLYQNVIGGVLWLLVLFFTLFYFLVDGREAIRKFMYLSPLRDEYEELLMKRFVSMSRATLKGVVVVGAVQAALGGIAFVIAGVPAPAVWTFVMFVLSIIPMLGTGLVWFPAGVILILLGNFWGGILVLFVGFVFISTVDNFLRPRVVGRDAQMHTLLIFFATLGGIVVFGLIGFIIGPIIMALFLAMWEIYGSEFRKQLANVNK